MVGASEGGGRRRIPADRQSGHGVGRGLLPLLKSSTAVCHCCIAGANQQPKARRSEQLANRASEC